jgi:hypothetical protein
MGEVSFKRALTRRDVLGGAAAAGMLFGALRFGTRDAFGKGPHPLASVPATALDAKSIGHIRHINKLASQLPGEWAEMGDGAVGWFDVPERTLRYQLANMAYAIASAQYNRTPAYHEMYQSTLLALFNRLLEPDCWREWINVSRGGNLQDPEQKALAEGWIDPIRRHNIMYGGHVLEVAALYDTLYRERRFLPKGSIKLVFSEHSWGFGTQTFEYDIPSIAKLFYDQFAELNFEGFPCEPTLMFPECPQHAVLGMMLSDELAASTYSQEVRTKYLEQFNRLGYVDANTKSFRLAYRRSTRAWLPDVPMVWADGWTGTFMHGWAPEYVEALYPAQRDRHLPNVLDRRRTGTKLHVADSTAGLGYLVGYAAELGDRATVDTLLGFADEHLGGAWHDGRYYYPRNDDTRVDDRGVLRLNSALQGNALIPFGRLNVGGGLWRLHNRPWSESDLRQPHIINVDYAAAGVSEAYYDSARRTLSVAFLPGPLAVPRSSFDVVGLDPRVTYKASRDGRAVGEFVSGAAERDGIARSADGVLRVQLDPRKPARFTVAAL